MKHWHLVRGNCRVCLKPMIPVPDAPIAGVHPGCDRSRRVWWPAKERAVWLAARHDRSETGDTT